MGSFLKRIAVLFLLILSTGAVVLSPEAVAQIHSGKTGQELINALQTDYTPSQTLGYDVARDEMYRYLDTRDGVLIGRYGGYSVDIPSGQDPSSTAYQNGSGISAEHVFPQSQGAGNEPAKSDMHNLFPVKQTINAARSNYPFDEITDSDTDAWYVNATSQSSTPATNIDGYSERDGSDGSLGPRFEPRESHKGNTARAMFYFMTIYETEANQAFFDAQEDVLLQWHQDDPVDANEEDLTNWIQSKQGTANPFVLDPTLAARAFDTASSSPTVSLTASSQSVSEGDGSVAVTAQINNPDGSEVDVDLGFNSGSSTATTADIGGYVTQTITFGTGAANGDTRTFTVTLTDDADTEITETATFGLQNLQTTGSTVLSSPQQTEVSIADNDGGSGASRLVISQYVETDSGSEPKGIELWNVSGAAIDFSANNLTVNRYANGGASPTQEFALTSGTLADGDVMVIGGNDATEADLKGYMDTNEPSVSFYEDSFQHNGNDALEVVLGGQTEDVFGTIGSDPGSAWTGSGVSTADQTIQLLGGITSGTTTGFTDPSTRFETVSTSPSSAGTELSGFGIAPASACPAPGAQPTTLSLTAASGNQIDGSFTASIADEYLVAGSSSSNLSAVPSDGTTYAAGDPLGTGTVVQVGSGTSFSDTGLSESTTYHYFVFAASTTSCTSGGPTYLTSGELTGSATTDSPSLVLLYEEDFEDESAGDTAPAQGDWSLDVTNANISSGDHFEIKSRTTNVLEAQDLDGEATWTTGSIDISSASSVDISLDAIEVGDHEASNDYFDVKYSLDGGSFTLVENWNGNGSSSHTLIGDSPDDNDWGTEAITVNDLSGSTLQIRVAMQNGAASENMRLDNVVVTASNAPIVQFATGTQSVSEGGGSTGLVVELLNPDDKAVDVDVAFQSSSSTADASDIDSFSSQTVSFDASAADGATQTVSVPITDDGELEGDETAQFALQNLSTSGTTQIGTSTLDLTITDNDAVSAGEVYITEIMQNPDAGGTVDDADGEYVELYNTRSSPLDLNGWTISDAGTNSHSINSSVTIPANGYAVLCRNDTSPANGGVSCDYQWSSIAIANGDDEVILTSSTGMEIDRVEYDGGPNWPDPTGKAMIFLGDAEDDNNDPANWSTPLARNTLSGGDLGSPGSANGNPDGDETMTISGTAGWRMLASPVNGLTVGDLAAQNAVQGVEGSYPGGAPNLYTSYDGPGASEDPQYWTPASSTSDDLPSGTGYIWYLYDVNDNMGSVALPFDLNHSGASPTSDVSRFVPASEDWHLMGNPFPMDIMPGAISLGGCQETVQIYDPSAAGYVPVDASAAGTTPIAPGQGFFIQCTGTTNEVTIENVSRRTTPSATFYSTSPTRNLTLRLDGTDESDALITRDQAILRPRTDGRLEWDRRDASKLLPLAQPYAALSLTGPGARGGTETHVIRSIPEELPGTLEIPLHIETAGTDAVTTYTLRWPEETLSEGWTVELIDQDRGTTTNLREVSSYSVSAADVGVQGAATEANPAMSSSRFMPRPLDPTRRPVSLQTASTPRFVLRLSPAPLPVELTAFDAIRQTGGVTLSWSTASETNNAGFYVEMQSLASGDSTTTESDWTTLGFVEGTGTTDVPQSYQFETGEVPYGAHAFRLRQVDTDGIKTTTDPVTVEVQLDQAYAVEAPYPSPASSQATLPVTVRETQNVQVHIYDMLGRRVETVHDGQIRAQSTREIILDTGRLASGTYFVRIQGNDFVATERLTVVR